MRATRARVPVSLCSACALCCLSLQNDVNHEISRNTVGYRVISRERQVRFRRSKQHRVAQFKTNKLIRFAYSCVAWNVHMVYKTERRRFFEMSFPSHFSTETRNFRLWGPRATFYNQKPLGFEKFKIGQFFWKLKYESSGIGENLLHRTVHGYRAAGSRFRAFGKEYLKVYRKRKSRYPKYRLVLSRRKFWYLPRVATTRNKGTLLSSRKKLQRTL